MVKKHRGRFISFTRPCTKNNILLRELIQETNTYCNVLAKRRIVEATRCSVLVKRHAVVYHAEKVPILKKPLQSS